MTHEFEHYPGCKHDPDNCGACALMTGDENGPNYAGWPLSYMENRRSIPSKWRKAFDREFARTDNNLYVANLKKTLAEFGVKWK